ncbi:MAG: VOC family protein [SAR324 cluster bacterium]|nr:VOC family protein [SAR324 cluster bacterium]
MKYLHTMIRVQNLESALDFFINKLGMMEVRRKEVPEGKFTLVFLAASEDEPLLELTYNWEQSEPYSSGENFGHVAYGVENIYNFCEKLQNAGVTILRPPKDGKMAFIRSPDQISVELLQIGDSLPIQEPWASMKNQGTW